MTRYQEVQTVKKESARDEKESRRLSEKNGMMSNLTVYLNKSQSVEGVIRSLESKGSDVNVREKALGKIASFVEKNYGSYLSRDYRNTPYYDVYPTADVIITNNPDVFAHLIDTRESRELECTGTGYGSSHYEYKQYTWEPILNDDIEVNSYGKDYPAFHSVDFDVNEPYLLFGWNNKWKETEYRKDAFKEEDGKQVETLHTSRFTSKPDIIRYTILLYLPDKEKDFYKKTFFIRDFVKKHTPRPPGFFARLFGK